MPGRLLPRRGLATFAVLVVVAEIVGRALIGHLDGALHVQPLAPPGASYYPFLLVAVKVVGALTLAAALARGMRARAAAEAGERLLAAVGHTHERRTPRLRPGISPRIWLGSFLATALAFLVHSDADGILAGRWQVFDPWLHTYALPVFAVLAVVVAFLLSLAGWVEEVEEYAERTIARVRRILAAGLPTRVRQPRPGDGTAPRRRFGLAFESRPPPLLA